MCRKITKDKFGKTGREQTVDEDIKWWTKESQFGFVSIVKALKFFTKECIILKVYF